MPPNETAEYGPSRSAANAEADGLTLGAVAVLLCIAGAVYLAVIDKTEIAAALLGAPLAATIGWLVNARVRRADIDASADVGPGREAKD